jgi:lysophospholipase L1-like esterase
MSATKGSATPGPGHPVSRPVEPRQRVRRPGRDAVPATAGGPQFPLALPSPRPRPWPVELPTVRVPLPTRWRSLLLRVVGAGAGTVVFGGMLVGAEVLAARRRTILPETDYDRVLRFEGRWPGTGRLLRLAVMGDSTTTGVGTERVEQTYAAIVGMALVDHGPVEVHVVGRASARVAHVLATQLPLAREIDPDLVLLVVGANDATHVTPLREVRQAIKAILDGCGDRPVVLAGVPALGLTTVLHHPLRELSDRRGRQVNRLLKRAAANRDNVHFVPLAIRPNSEDTALWHGYLAADGFHPSAVGYARWALELVPALLAADPRRPAGSPGGQEGRPGAGEAQRP